MRQLYLVYRVMPDGMRHPETFMALDERAVREASETLNLLITGDAPEQALRPGECWEFIDQDDASEADWDEIVRPGGRSLTY